MANESDAIRELLRTTPTYMTHVTVGRWLLDALLKEVADLQKKVKTLEDENSIPIPNFDVKSANRVSRQRPADIRKSGGTGADASSEAKKSDV